MAVKNQMPLEWSYNIIYHFLCLLKNPASLRSTFAVSGGFRPLMKGRCKALAMWLTPRKAPWLVFLSLFPLQLPSSRAMAPPGWCTGSDAGRSVKLLSSSTEFGQCISLAVMQHAPPEQAEGEGDPVTSSTEQPERSSTAPRSWRLLQRNAARPCRCRQRGRPPKGVRHGAELEWTSCLPPQTRAATQASAPHAPQRQGPHPFLSSRVPHSARGTAGAH